MCASWWAWCPSCAPAASGAGTCACTPVTPISATAKHSREIRDARTIGPDHCMRNVPGPMACEPELTVQQRSTTLLQPVTTSEAPGRRRPQRIRIVQPAGVDALVFEPRVQVIEE